MVPTALADKTRIACPDGSTPKNHRRVGVDRGAICRSRVSLPDDVCSFADPGNLKFCRSLMVIKKDYIVINCLSLMVIKKDYIVIIFASHCQSHRPGIVH